MKNKEINYPHFYGSVNGLMKVLANDFEYFTMRKSVVSEELLIGSVERTLKLWRDVEDEFEQAQLGEVLEDGDTNADILTPGEIDELNRIDQAKQKAGRVPHEI